MGSRPGRSRDTSYRRRSAWQRDPSGERIGSAPEPFLAVISETTDLLLRGCRRIRPTKYDGSPLSERRDVMSIPPENGDVPERSLHERERDERERAGIQAEDNELRASGKICARCGQVITASQDVRLRADGQFVHEVCPEADGQVV